jgi:hypothetical protein
MTAGYRTRLRDTAHYRAGFILGPVTFCHRQSWLGQQLYVGSGDIRWLLSSAKVERPVGYKESSPQRQCQLSGPAQLQRRLEGERSAELPQRPGHL